MKAGKCGGMAWPAIASCGVCPHVGTVPSSADGAFRPRPVEGLERFERIAGRAGG